MLFIKLFLYHLNDTNNSDNIYKKYQRNTCIFIGQIRICKVNNCLSTLNLLNARLQLTYFFLDVNVKYQDQNFSSVLIKTKISLWSEILNNLFCTKWMGFQGHGNYNPKLIYIKYNFTKLML